MLAVRAGAHHAPAPGAISASARAPRGRPRHEPWLKRLHQRILPPFFVRGYDFSVVSFSGGEDTINWILLPTLVHLV